MSEWGILDGEVVEVGDEAEVFEVFVKREWVNDGQAKEQGDSRDSEAPQK